jgi:hypothetical protein
MSKEIPLSRGFVTIVDDEDYGELSKHKWTYDGNGYAVRYARTPDGRRARKSMSRQIMGDPVGFWVDHINSDTLDNRRNNLRICTPAENCRNRAVTKRKKGFPKGVNKRGSRFQAQIRSEGQAIYLGMYRTAEEAACAYDKKALELFGEYARINFTKETVDENI